jgi:hypothetical protein
MGTVIQLLREPCISSAFDHNDAFNLYQSNRAAFAERAKRATQEHAMGGS